MVDTCLPHRSGVRWKSPFPLSKKGGRVQSPTIQWWKAPSWSIGKSRSVWGQYLSNSLLIFLKYWLNYCMRNNCPFAPVTLYILQYSQSYLRAAWDSQRCQHDWLLQVIVSFRQDVGTWLLRLRKLGWSRHRRSTVGVCGSIEVVKV